MFKMPITFEKKKLLIFNGVGFLLIIVSFLLSPVLMFWVSKMVNLDINYTSEIIKSIFFSFFCLIFLNVFLLVVVEGIIDILIGFHQKYNNSNLNKNPIKSVIENKDKIIKGIKLVFIIGLCLGFYGIWLGKK